jgi:hypothetical protein
VYPLKVSGYRSSVSNDSQGLALDLGRSASRHTARRRLIKPLMARALLRDLASKLRAAHIAAMPLKGVLLQSSLYQAGWTRSMSDVDVLVPEEDFERALHVLAAAGCSCASNGSDEAHVYVPGHALPADLHRRLLPRATFALRTEDVFARARRDQALFGCELWLPDPLDLYAHLVGHFLMSRARAHDPHNADFAAVARAHALDPARYARRLEATGLARAARYVLPLVAANAADGFALRVLRELRPDAFGDALAFALRRVLPNVSEAFWPAALGTHMLGQSLGAGVRGLSGRMLDLMTRTRDGATSERDGSELAIG